MQKIKVLMEAAKLSLLSRPRLFIVSQIISIIYGLSYGLTTLLIQKVIQSVVANLGFRIQAIYVSSLVLVIFTGFFCNHLLNQVNAHLASHVEVKANQKLFSKLLKHEPISFERADFNDRLELAFGITQPIGYVGLIIVGLFTTNLLAIISSAAVLYRSNPLLAGILLLCFIPNLYQFFRKAESRDEIKEKLAELRRETQVASEMLIGVEFNKETRALGASGFLEANFRNSLKNEQALDVLNQQQNQRYDLQSKVLSLIADGAAIGLCIFLLYASRIDVAAFTAALAAIASFSFVIEQFFFNDLQTLIDFYGDLAIYQEFLDEQVETRKSQKLLGPPEIEFKNVSFAYPGQEEAVLKNVSIDIKSGERIALVGFNGAGKSTFVKLATGLFMPGEGEVLIDGKSSRDWKIFGEFGAVFQDYSVYKLSLAENISIARGVLEPNARLEELMPETYIQDFAGQGLEGGSLIGREFKGTELSGGWQQTIAILRAVNSRKNYYIFDEASSAIDPQREEKLIKLMLNTSEGKTAIFVTHRMALCQFVDRIILLEDGRIIEQGAFKDLYLEGSRFYQYYHEQEKWFH
ncbi:MAG: ABC transporter ATP-binding protein [Eubacteriales bacterium]|nr:ABC transporter ATP-binding protein [Eubacteriales bacterium]